MRLKRSELYLGFKNKKFKISCKNLPERGIVYRDNLIAGIISSRIENKYYRLEGNLKAKTEHTCVRCLRDFPFNLDQQVNIMLLPDTERYVQDSSLDVLSINTSSDYIDLSEIFADLIALSEPIKPLCHEKCNGICPYCGIEKKTICGCKYQKDTSAWDKLKEIQI